MRIDILSWDTDWRELGPTLVRHIGGDDPPAAVLLWSLAHDPPTVDALSELLCQADDVWHGGLRLGMAGLPRTLDFVAPIWRFNRDAAPDIESMSWRLSLRACLIRTTALRTVGQPDARYDTQGGAALDYGRRLLEAGALLRHVPWFAPNEEPCEALTAHDELRFVARHHGRKWALWAAGRAIRHAPSGGHHVLRALPRALKASTPSLVPLSAPGRPEPLDARVTVLIPTIERYPYLRTVLDQLRHQTIPAHQVIVVDQTPVDDQDGRLAADFVDLPLDLIVLGHAGQATARNEGLRRSTGEAVLFLDDDVEIEPDLIERHLRALSVEGVEVSCGIAHEPSVEVVQPRWRQASPVFPAGNALVLTSALAKSGLFDRAFDHGVRADGDLGMRLYLAGCRLMLDPSIDVLHHRAPQGGLRRYGERATTYSGSRSSLLERNHLAPTEVYFARRYFTDRQVREALLLRQLGALARHGSVRQRALRIVVQLVLLPSTVRQARRAVAAGERLGREYPQIPALGEP